MIQRRLTESGKEERRVDRRNTLNELSGKEWIQATASVWYQRGLGREHPDTLVERQHPAAFAYKMVERLLLFFTRSGDRVLDPFVGVGSTLKACALTGREGWGLELSPKWAELSRKRLQNEAGGGSGQRIVQGDARETLQELGAETFDFAVTSPPYWGILNKPADHRVREERLKNNLETRYSDDPNDLANIPDYALFMGELGKVFRECHRILRRSKYMAVVVADFRHKSRYFAFHSDVSRAMEEAGFVPKGIIIYVKNAKKLYPYGYPFAFVPNVHHEYILIFQKDGVNGIDG